MKKSDSTGGIELNYEYPDIFLELASILVTSLIILSAIIGWLPAPPGGIGVSGVPIDPDEVDRDEGAIPSVGEPVIISW